MIPRHTASTWERSLPHEAARHGETSIGPLCPVWVSNDSHRLWLPRRQNAGRCRGRQGGDRRLRYSSRLEPDQGLP